VMEYDALVAARRTELDMLAILPPRGAQPESRSGTGR